MTAYCNELRDRRHVLYFSRYRPWRGFQWLRRPLKVTQGQGRQQIGDDCCNHYVRKIVISNRPNHDNRKFFILYHLIVVVVIITTIISHHHGQNELTQVQFINQYRTEN